MEELIRTKVSRFELTDSLTLEEVSEMKEIGRLNEILVPIDAMFSEYEAVTMKKEFAAFAYNGNLFMPKHICERITLTDGKQVRVYDEEGTFIAIYAFCKDKWMFQIVKMFWNCNDVTIQSQS